MMSQEFSLWAVLSALLLAAFAGQTRSEERVAPEPSDPAAGVSSSTPDTLQRRGYWLGLEASPVSRALAAQLNLDQGAGLVIDAVISESPAEKAGLKPYDVLVEVDGRSLETVDALKEAIQRSNGKEMTLRTVRAGKERTTRIKPGELPAHEASPSARGWERVEILGPYLSAAYIVRPVELPNGVKVTITKEGKLPTDVVVTRGDQKWTVQRGALDKLPSDLRKPIALYLRDPLAEVETSPLLPTAGPAAMPDPSAPAESAVARRLDEVLRRLEAIEAKLRNDAEN